jgi:hypothetical protein
MKPTQLLDAMLKLPHAEKMLTSSVLPVLAEVRILLAKEDVKKADDLEAYQQRWASLHASVTTLQMAR